MTYILSVKRQSSFSCTRGLSCYSCNKPLCVVFIILLWWC